MSGGIKLICNNKKAHFEYFIEETYEAGLVLSGSEVKSIRADRVNINDAFVLLRGGEAYLKNVNIVPYEKGSHFNPESKRDRKLLLHKTEISRLQSKIEAKGYTVIPTKLYLKNSLVKVELGLGRGKQLHDKRETIARRETDRKINREIREYFKK
jgi:SsrA-binding protein